jgi:hypothetical protein
MIIFFSYCSWSASGAHPMKRGKIKKIRAAALISGQKDYVTSFFSLFFQLFRVFIKIN